MDERVAFLHLWVGVQVLAVFCTYAPANSSSEYTPFLDSLGQVLEGAPTWTSIVLPGDFNGHIGNDSMTWRGIIGLIPKLTVQLVDSQLSTL